MAFTRFCLCISIIFLFSVQNFGQTVRQTLRGRVIDADSKSPLAGVAVQISETNYTAQTDADGSFVIQKVSVGRYTLQFSLLGYGSLTRSEVLVEAAKETIVEVSLAVGATQLNEVTVRSQLNATPTNGLQTITNEQVKRYAGTFFDPARLAASFAGVAAANDQANALVIRGNSPNGLQYRLEGVEIVNPNHLTNAGTFSDRPTQSGGGTAIVSAQVLDRADFYTGALPAEFGNATAGVMDMRLRKGNDAKHEFTAQLGLIGLDVAAEGPLSKRTTYLVNYRYSFTGLLAAAGVKLGDEDIRYQDLSFNITTRTKRAGTFTFFGMGGSSSNVFEAQRDASKWLVQKDGFDINFSNNMGAIGLTHTVSLSPRTALRTVVVASALRSTRRAERLSMVTYQPTLLENDLNRKERYTLASTLNHRFNGVLSAKGGFNLSLQKDSLLAQNAFAVASFGVTKGIVFEPFAALRWEVSPRLEVNAGLHFLYYSSNQSQSVEPRLLVKYQLKPSQTLGFSYALQSQLQLPQLYFGIIKQAPDDPIRTNSRLGLNKSHHFSLAHQVNLSSQSYFKTEVYFQQLFNIPVVSLDSRLVPFPRLPAFSAINLVEGFVNQPLFNLGTGQNYGVELTYQRYLVRNFYVLATASVYKSTYKGTDGVERPTRFDGGHTVGLTTGKEFSRKPDRTFGINARILWLGGFRETPILLDDSRNAATLVYDESRAFSLKMADYFRPDLRLFWKRNKVGYTRTVSIDIQNVANIQNQSTQYFDALQRDIVRTYQLGVIPVLSYRVEF